ncbi:MAG TPA: RNA-binding protein [Aggregatilineales bacterium]|nr:RNA-binding protein [Anaerolineales bacterium]HRE46341.1 RNA-binding protein [Aggregatilineales bacterium]
MNKKLYVGNLPYNVTKEQLQELFEQCGEVKDAVVIMDRETGRSKGFGFVEMATTEAMQDAIKKYNGFNMGQRPLTVNEARPKEERRDGPPPRRNNRF